MSRQDKKNIPDGKVVKLLDHKHIVINLGFEKGVEIGDEFQIGKNLSDITDPDTGENLGHLIQPIETLEVTEVYPKFSILQKIERIRNGGSIPSALSSISALTMSESLYGKVTKQTRDIKLDESQIDTVNNELSEKISLGDIAVFKV